MTVRIPRVETLGLLSLRDVSESIHFDIGRFAASPNTPLLQCSILKGAFAFSLSEALEPEPIRKNWPNSSARARLPVPHSFAPAVPSCAAEMVNLVFTFVPRTPDGVPGPFHSYG